MRLEADWARLQTVQTYGHSVQAGSLDVDAYPADLSRYSDLPRNSEGEALIRPGWGGRALGEQYVFIYQENDTRPGRDGRVTARALLVPLEDVRRLEDLRPIFELLQDGRRFPTTGGRVTLEVPDERPQLTPWVAGILNAYTLARDKRVVLPDDETTAATLAGLWSRLWPEARARLSFRVHFGPLEIPPAVDAPPSLIIAQGAVSRWQHQPDFVLATPGAQGATALIRHLLGGARETQADMLLEHMTGSLHNLRGLDALLLDLKDVQQLKTPQSCILALDTLAGAPVSDTFRTSQQESLMQLLGQRLEHAQIGDILRLPRDVPDAERLKRHVQVWASTQFLHSPLEDVFRAWTGQPAWLKDAITRGLAQISPSVSAAELVWTHWSTLHAHGQLENLLSADWDAPLVNTLPEKVPGTALVVSQAAGLQSVYARLLAREEPVSALRLSLQSDAEGLAHTLTVLRDRWGDEVFLTSALTVDDERLDIEIHRALTDTPDLMRGLDVKHPAWLRLWAERLEDGNLLRGLPDPAATIATLFEEVLTGRSVPSVLLDAIARTPYASVLTHPSRDRLLKRLPGVYLDATASAYLGALSDPGSLTGRLKERVLDDLDMAVSAPVAYRLLTDHATTLNQQQLRTLLLQSGPALPAGVRSALLGAKRAVKPLVQTLADEHFMHGRGVSLEVLGDLQVLLRPMQQVRIAHRLGRTIASHTWWQAVKEVLIDAFPEGPQELWTSVGGKTPHLRGGSPEAQWSSAIDRVKARNKPSIGDLLGRAGEEIHGHDNTAILWEMRERISG